MISWLLVCVKGEGAGRKHLDKYQNVIDRKEGFCYTKREVGLVWSNI